MSRVGDGDAAVTQAEVLARLRRVMRRDWDVLNDRGRWLVLCCIQALERDAR
jgi:hypothetical protein